jgi:hypothetical protein
MVVRLPCWWEGEGEGDGMEGERGWSGLHSERAHDVESLVRACSPRDGLCLRAIGHKTPGRSLNSTAPASTEPTDGQSSTDHSS